MKAWWLLALVLLVAGCTGGGDPVASQLRGNQALLLILQNSADIDHMYFYSDQRDTESWESRLGDANVPSDELFDQRCANDPYNCPSSFVQIGELNLLMQNVGGSATAGGLYVSGYDPNLIRVESKLGQNPINDQLSSNCYNNVRVTNTGKYSVTRICASAEGFGYGFSIQGDDDGASTITGSVGGDKLSEWADWTISQVTQRDVNFFTKYGVFDSGDIGTCGLSEGEFGCTINFGTSVFDPFRISYGRLLLNTMYGQLATCGNKCRIFPPSAPSEVLNGVSPQYPVGDAIYYDYDIYLDRSKWNQRIEEMKQTFQITACYFYTTSATPSVCVDPDPTVSRNEPCSTAPIVFKDTQGAPIKVARIEQRPQPGAIAYTLFLEHVGNGEVWLPDAFEHCGPYLPGRPDYRMMDAVQVLDVRMSGDLRQLQCLPTSAAGRHIVRLQNGKGQITCLYPVNLAVTGGSRRAYTSALSIEIGYVYQNIIQKDVIIHRT